MKMSDSVKKSAGPEEKLMWNPTVPDEVMQTLRCCLCNEYLSQPPIYMYPSGHENACGRCPELTDHNPMRNAIYEAVVGEMQFPCVNKQYGCIAMIQFNEMAEHHANCTFKQYFCPFLPLAACSWQGPSAELYDHYVQEHEWLTLMSSSFEIDTITISEENYLLKDDENLFIVQVKTEEKNGISEDQNIWFTVRYIGPQTQASQFFYELELKSYDTTESVKLPGRAVESDNFTRLNEATAVGVNMDVLKMDLSDPSNIICYVKITRKERITENAIITENATATPVKVLKTEQSMDEELLRELECPVCNEYMQPPIHQCIKGHSICARCKNQVHECPTCRGVIQDTRNFLLEKMTGYLKYRCKFHDFDCTFVGTVEKLRQHESQCAFGPYHCPLTEFATCHWNGALKDVLDHVQTYHPTDLPNEEVATFIFRENDVSVVEYYIKRACRQMFKIVVQYKEKKLYWIVQFIGPQDQAKNFLFDLDIIDKSALGRKLHLQAPCYPFSSEEKTFKNFGNCVLLPWELISPLMVNDILTYRLRIYNNNVMH